MAVAESEIVARAQALFSAFNGRDWDAYFSTLTRTPSRFRVGGESMRPGRHSPAPAQRTSRRHRRGPLGASAFARK
jgi:hypothetical protein